MAFRSFKVGGLKGLKSAACDDAPNVMVIAGPNGVGKSSLLRLLKQSVGQAEPKTRVFYLGPYRSWRKSQISAAATYLMKHKYADLLGMDSIPGWSQFTPAGLQYVSGVPRDPDSIDEAQSLVKYSLIKLEMKRIQALKRQFEVQGEQIVKGTVPDPYEPIRRLTQFLLPHLVFSKIGFDDDANIKCLFRRRDGDLDELIDIDDLSSGEKAVISLFLPYLEHQILRLLGESEPDQSITALIDEPEIHLHPTLQMLLLDYLRDLSAAEKVQFIITTHSPTILDAAKDDELFVLAPLNAVGDENQLLRVASSAERLEAIRDLVGSTHAITRFRPIVFIEGVSAQSGGNVADQRLIELLLPESDAWVLAPASSRSEAIRAGSSLRDSMAEKVPSFPVFALVDADQRAEGDPEWVITWPVAMIENLLLDPHAIWELLAPYRERLNLKGEAEVRRRLFEIARELRADEIRLRVIAQIQPITIRADLGETLDPATAAASFEVNFRKWLDGIRADDRLVAISQRATEEVDGILGAQTHLERFRGKKLLKAFYDRWGKTSGLSYQSFTYELARHARRSERLKGLAARPVLQIQRYVPAGLGPVLTSICTEVEDAGIKAQATELQRLTQAARAAWETGRDDGLDRADLRSRLLKLARQIRAMGRNDWHREILASTVQMIGA